MLGKASLEGAGALAAGQCQLFALFGTCLVCVGKACARNGKGHSCNALVKCAAGKCQLFALFGTWLVCAEKARNGKGHSRYALVKCAGCRPMSTVRTFWDLACLCSKGMCQKRQRS